MKPATLSYASASMCLALSSTAMADVVTDWNMHGVDAGYTARHSPSLSARNMAIVHLAMFEALNSLEPRYTPYRARLPADAGSSPEAAAAAAAHYALVTADSRAEKAIRCGPAGIARERGGWTPEGNRHRARRAVRQGNPG